MRGRLIAVLAGTAALAVAPSYALAQNGFPDYRQATADQYPQQPPPGNPGPGNSGGGEQTGGSSGNERPVQHAGKGKGRRPGATKHRGASGIAPAGVQGGTAPVSVPTRPVPAAKGSLPFTGSDLSGLVILALILLATGFLLAAASRATRRRRRRAPA